MIKYVIPTACCAVALTGTPASGSDEAPPSVIEKMQQTIDELRSEVAALKARDGDSWLTEQRAAEVRSLVQDVLADADTRASLLQDGMTAGWDDGFFLASADGNFRLNIHGQLQTRFVWNEQDNPPSANGSAYGFEVPRAKLWFTGNVVSPNWVYKLEANFFGFMPGVAAPPVGLVPRAPSMGTAVLEDAYLGYVVDDTGFILLAGQFKVPMLREELVASGHQTAVERSLVNEEFTAGRTQGFAVDWRNDDFHVTAGITNGHPATGGYNLPALTPDTEISLTARGEWLFRGDWSQFDDFAGWRGQDYGLLLGGAVHWQKGESGTAFPQVQVLQWTLDMSVEGSGWNVFTYFVGRHLTDGFSADQLGFVFQGGYFLTDDWEIFGRWEWADDDLPGDDLSVVTIGATRYFAEHQLKWTTDVGVGLNSVTGPFGGGLLGTGGGLADWRTDTATEDGQLVLRSQVQLLF